MSKKSKQCRKLHKNDYLQNRSNQEYEAGGGEDESFIERLKSDKGDQDNFFDEDFDPVLRDIQARNPNSDRSDDDHRYPHLLIFFQLPYVLQRSAQGSRCHFQKNIVFPEKYQLQKMG